MKLDNGEIWGANGALQRLIQMPFSVKTSYQLAKLVKKLTPQLEVIDEVRNSLIRKYGKREGRQLAVSPNDEENFPKFTEEWDQLMEEEIEIAIEPVQLPEKIASTCEKCHHNMDKSLEIEPAILMPLIDKFIVV